MARPKPSISDGEYQRWYTPQEVLDALPSSWAWDTRIRLVATAMGDGLIRVAAGELTTEREPKPLVNWLLPPKIWTRWGCLADPDFWDAGHRTIYHDAAGWTGPTFTIYRARLDPKGVEKLAPGQMQRPARLGGEAVQHPITKPRQTSSRAPKIDRAALASWCRDFGAKNPDASFKVFLTNARLHFPNLHVSEMPVKQEIAKLGLTKTRGNPAITRKNR